MAIKIAAFGIFVSVILILLRQENKSFAMTLNILAGIFIFYLILPELNKILLMLNNLGENIKIQSNYILILEFYLVC